MKIGLMRKWYHPLGCRWIGSIIFTTALAAFSLNAKADSLLEWAAKAVTAFTSAPSTSTPDAVSPHMHGAPLPSGADAASEKDFRKVYLAWLNRAIVLNFPAAKDPKGAAYLAASVQYLSRNQQIEAPAALQAQERSFDLQTVNDPGLLLMIGIIEPPSARHIAALDKALSLFPGSTYPKFLWFMASANAGKAESDMHANADELKARDDVSLKYLDAGLRDGSFLPGEMSALRWRFDAGSVEDLFSRNGQQVADIFESSPNADPWVKDYVAGVNFVKAAWDSRGADWAKSVTPQGWHGFAQNLSFARTHLVKSWNENPHDPAAAAEMIKVCMGESEATDTMRSWFDHSVAADFDYMRAYGQLTWGLRPRWLGNFAEMDAFGRECAATGRYDTCVPDEQVAVVLDICDDTDVHGAPLENPHYSGEVLTVLNKYFEQPNPELDIIYSHTVAAIAAHKAGRMDEAKRHLAAISYKPYASRFLMGLDDIPGLVTQTQALP